MIPFFITGLPRSRTAWLANYFSYGLSVCWHDLLHRMSLRDIMAGLAKTGATYGGYSDPALLLHWREVVKLYPEAKWILIDRPTAEVAKSWKQITGDKTEAFLEDLIQEMNQLASSVADGYLVKYNGIDQQLEKMAALVTPSYVCPPWRANMLKTFNVQITLDGIVEALRRKT